MCFKLVLTDSRERIIDASTDYREVTNCACACQLTYDWFSPVIYLTEANNTMHSLSFWHSYTGLYHGKLELPDKWRRYTVGQYQSTWHTSEMFFKSNVDISIS